MTLQGFEVQAAKPKGERASEDEPAQQPIRPGEKSPADRRNLTNDERTVKRRRRRVHAAYSAPGYYLVDKDATPQSERFETVSEAEAQLEPDSGQLIQYLDQAPNSSHVAEPFPPNLNQVNGSLRMSAHTDDEFLFVAADADGDSDEDMDTQDEGMDDKTAALSDDRINDAYERHLQWSKANGHNDPDTVSALRAHERSGGITRAEANGVADLQGIGGGDSDWRSQGHRDEPWPVKEGQLLAAMAKATGPEQQRLMGELEGLRREARQKVLADREIDLADAYIHDTLTPVRVHEHHTAATDWIEDVAEPDLSAQAVHQAMVVEAQEWRRSVSAAVRQDREEYLEQARGRARITASAMGPHREMAFQTFMRTAVEEDQDQQGPASMIQPWAMPPMPLPPTGGGDAPFGIPSGNAPLNGQNFNPMATEVYPGSQILPLDNGASAWPPADNLEGEEPLPPVAPDNYNAVGAETHMSSRREAASDYSPRSGMGGRGGDKPFKATHTYSPIGWDAFDARPHPGSKSITPGVPVQNHGYMSPRGPGGMRLVHVSDESGNHQTIDSRSLGKLSRGDDAFDREQDQDILERNEERRQPYDWDPQRRESGGSIFESNRRQAGYSDEFPHRRHMETQHPGYSGDDGGDPEAAHRQLHGGDWSTPATDGDSIMSAHPDLAEHEKYPGLYDLSTDLGRRFLSSQNFNGPKQTYQEYVSRLSEGSTPMDQEHWAGSMAAVTPAPSNTSIPVTSMMRWGERGTNPDPTGADLAGNPMAGYPEGGNWDKDEAHAQSGEAQSNLPLAPEGPMVAEHLDYITDFPDTGPAEVPSDRAWNIDANQSAAGHDSGVTHGAAASTYDTYHDTPYDDDTLGESQYMSEVPHDFESGGGSQYCRHCGEARRHPMHVYAARMAAGKPPLEPDRSNYATTPGGEAQSTEQYEQAYSSGRNIDYSETGIGQLGTVPVQGYGVTPNGEMFPWQVPPGPGPVGAADVADVPPPGAGQVGAAQPTDLNNPEAPEGKQAALRAMQRRIRHNMGARR
jgi:hypothetical protein